VATVTITRGKTLPDSGVKADLHDLIDLASGSISNIVNADISSSAAIAGSKIAPNFGAQNVVCGDVTASGDVDITGSLTVSGSAIGNPVVQVVQNNYVTSTTGTTVIPGDTSKPQNTEGDEYITQAITPLATTNILVVEAILHVAHTTAGSKICMALFQDSTADALACAMGQEDAGRCYQIVLRYKMLAGTTSETTFKIRAGSENAGTTTINGVGGSSFYGGALTSSLTITEYAAE